MDIYKKDNDKTPFAGQKVTVVINYFSFQTQNLLIMGFFLV